MREEEEEKKKKKKYEMRYERAGKGSNDSKRRKLYASLTASLCHTGFVATSLK